MMASEYIVAALARSAAARPELIVTSQGELLAELNRIVEELFLDAAQANAPFFNARSNLPYDVLLTPPGWPWTDDMLRPYLLEVSADTTGMDAGWVAGDEVIIVPVTDRFASLEQPSVLSRGRAFLPTGVTGHPTGGSLVVEYARRPFAMAGLGSAIDGAWPAEHDGLIIDRLALWATRKDGRLEEVDGLKSEESLRFARFAAAVGIPVPIEANRTARTQGARQQRL